MPSIRTPSYTRPTTPSISRPGQNRPSMPTTPRMPRPSYTPPRETRRPFELDLVEVFHCMSCNARVSESAKKCPSCGAHFNYTKHADGTVDRHNNLHPVASAFGVFFVFATVVAVIRKVFFG